MWSFKKKEEMKLDLPPLPNSRRDDDEITLLPEKGMGMIPEELPELETPNKQTPISVPKKEPMPQMAVRMAPRAVKPIQTRQEKFLNMENFKAMLSEINNINLDFNNMDSSISKVIDLKDERYDKVDVLQNTLEDISKRMILLENTLFGG